MWNGNIFKGHTLHVTSRYLVSWQLYAPAQHFVDLRQSWRRQVVAAKQRHRTTMCPLPVLNDVSGKVTTNRDFLGSSGRGLVVWNRDTVFLGMPEFTRWSIMSLASCFSLIFSCRRTISAWDIWVDSGTTFWLQGLSRQLWTHIVFMASVIPQLLAWKSRTLRKQLWEISGPPTIQLLLDISRRQAPFACGKRLCIGKVDRQGCLSVREAIAQCCPTSDIWAYME